VAGRAQLTPVAIAAGAGGLSDRLFGGQAATGHLRLREFRRNFQAVRRLGTVGLSEKRARALRLPPNITVFRSRFVPLYHAAHHG